MNTTNLILPLTRRLGACHAIIDRAGDTYTAKVYRRGKLVAEIANAPRLWGVIDLADMVMRDHQPIEKSRTQ